jgi:alkylated DNA repair dioxygenase AlkB
MSDLFSHHQSFPIDVISFEGNSRYFGPIISTTSANSYFQKLLSTIVWKNDELIIYGKRFVTSRKMAWHGDTNTSYKYSGIDHIPLPFTKELFEIKLLIETLSGATYNSCLLNLYHNGSEGMGWHRDNEKEIKAGSTIASLSLGAERIFRFKNIHTKQTKEICLQNGSLLTMEGPIQQHWMHCLPKTKKVSEPRINLTFRQVIPTTNT